MLTVDKIAEKLGVNSTTSRALIKYLVKSGAVKVEGTERTNGKRGRGQYVYAATDEIEETLNKVANVFTDDND